MKWTLTAVALLMAGQAFAQEAKLSPTAHRTVPTERPSENIAGDHRFGIGQRPPAAGQPAGHREQPAGEGSWTGFHWSNENVDRTLADEGRIQVLAALTELAAHD